MLSASRGRAFFIARDDDLIFELDPACGTPKSQFSVHQASHRGLVRIPTTSPSRRTARCGCPSTTSRSSSCSAPPALLCTHDRPLRLRRGREPPGERDRDRGHPFRREGIRAARASGRPRSPQVEAAVLDASRRRRHPDGGRARRARRAQSVRDAPGRRGTLARHAGQFRLGLRRARRRGAVRHGHVDDRARGARADPRRERRGGRRVGRVRRGHRGRRERRT